MSSSEDDWDFSDTSSRSDQQDSYEVERIIHEAEDPDGRPLYLVKWKGYADYRSTWEPESNFESPGNVTDFYSFFSLRDFSLNL